MNAVAKTLGLAPDHRETDFEAIIPAVQDADLKVGMSSFTDTAEREAAADFVTYFEAETLWAALSRVFAGFERLVSQFDASLGRQHAGRGDGFEGRSAE